MVQSVSNDALWVKLSEIEEKIDRQKTPASTEQVDISLELMVNKDEVIAEIKERAKLLGMHGDSNYAAINQNIGTVREIVEKVGNVVARIRKQQRESAEQVEPQKENTTVYFNFRFFKVEKTSLFIVVFGLLVFTFTVFSMKQQNDYSFLLDEYYKLRIELRDVQTENDSLQKAVIPTIKKKK